MSRLYPYILLLLPLLVACTEEEEITLATATDNYVTGQLRGQDFTYDADSQPAGVLLDGEDHSIDQDTLLGLTKATIVRGQADRDRAICITFSIPNDKEFAYPLRSDLLADCFADFMVVHDDGLRMALDERHPVELTVTQWTEAGDLRGTFRGKGSELSGEFRIQLRLP